MPNYRWTTPGAPGNNFWGDAGNWVQPTINTRAPNATDDTAGFLGGSDGNSGVSHVVSLGGESFTVQRLEFLTNSTTNFTIAGVGGETLTMQSAAGIASIAVLGSGAALTASLTNGIRLQLNSTTQVSIDTGYAFNLQSQLLGMASLLKAGGGTLNLGNSTNSWSGGIGIDAGTVRMTAANSLSNGLVRVGEVDTDNGTSSGATLNLNGFNQSITNLVGDGIITNGSTTAATLTLLGGSQNLFDPFRIQDGAGIINLVKSGSGDLTLSGANTFTGTTTVSGGTVFLAGSTGTGELANSSSINLTGGNLNVINFRTVNIQNISIAGSSMLRLDDGSSLNVTAANGTVGTGFIRGSTNSTLTFNLSTNVFSLAGTQFQNWSTGAGNTITINGTAGANTITGSSQNDIINAGNSDDTVNSGDGDDFVDGGFGSDTLNGGNGIDTVSYAFWNGRTIFQMAGNTVIFADNNGVAAGTESVTNFENVIGSLGNNTLIGTSGANRLEGQGGDDALVGDAGGDTLIGNGGNDNLFGQADGDTINGGAGNDLIDGGTGSDTMTGGANNDTFMIRRGDGVDIITDFAAGGTDDVIDLSDYFTTLKTFQQVMALAVQSGPDVVITFSPGNSLTLWNTLLNQLTAADFIVNVLNGTFSGETLIGTSSRETINGIDGNDVIDGLGGGDTIAGGEGNDTIYYYGSDIMSNITGGNGTDMLLVVNGTAPTTFNLTGQGFESARTVVNDVNGNLAWTVVTENYNAAWQLLSTDTVNDDGTRLVYSYDRAALSWNIVTDNYNAAGGRVRQDIVNDNGTYRYYFWDLANANSWLTFDEEYTAAGQRHVQRTTNDDGSYRYFYWDVTNAQPWATSNEEYTAAGVRTSTQVVNDNNTIVTQTFDHANANGWSSIIDYTNATGQRTEQRIINDNNSYVRVFYDPTNAFPWSTQTDTYNTLGVLVSSVQVPD